MTKDLSESSAGSLADPLTAEAEAAPGSLAGPLEGGRRPDALAAGAGAGAGALSGTAGPLGALSDEGEPALYTRGSVWGHIFRGGTPGWLALLSVMSFGLADALFIAKIGIVPLAAYTFFLPVTFLLIEILLALGESASSLVSRALGRREKLYARQLAIDGILLSFFVALGLALFFPFLLPFFYRLFGVEAEILASLQAYANLWLWSIPLMAVPITGNHVLRAHGESFWPSATLILASVVNIILDPILIFGWFFFPELGIAGAAWATVIARGGMFAMNLVLLCQKRVIVLPFRVDWKVFRVSVRTYLRLVIYITADRIAEPIADFFLLFAFSRYEPAIIAAYGLGHRLISIMYSVHYGLSIFVTPFSGQNWGARTTGRILEMLRHVGLITVVWTVVGSLFFWIFADSLVRQFVEDPQAIAFTKTFLFLIPVATLGSGILVLFNAFLYGLGEGRLGFYLKFIYVWVLFVPVLLWISHITSDPKRLILVWFMCDFLILGVICGVFMGIRKRLFQNMEAVPSGSNDGRGR